MTQDEYAEGLIEILTRGWSCAVDNLETRYAMGRAETHWLAQVPKAKRPDYFAYARDSIYLDLDGEPVSLHEFLGTF